MGAGSELGGVGGGVVGGGVVGGTRVGAELEWVVTGSGEPLVAELHALSAAAAAKATASAMDRARRLGDGMIAEFTDG